MRAHKYDVLRSIELMRQGMLSTGQHVKFSNDPNHIPDNSLEAQMARRLLRKRTSDRGHSGKASKSIKEQLRQFFTEAADALASRPFGGPTRPVKVPEFLKSCNTTKVPYLVIDKE